MTPGLGTLREAIFNANLTPGAQTITFAIPATDPRHFYYRDDGVAGQVSTGRHRHHDRDRRRDHRRHRPRLAVTVGSRSCRATTCRRSSNTVTIDGYSQPGSNQNTLPASGLEHRLEDRARWHQCAGHRAEPELRHLSGDASNSRIDGLAINRFGGDGIDLNTLDGGNVIDGNFIGTDVSGTIGLGNGGSGIYLSFEDGDTIGGTSIRPTST